MASREPLSHRHVLNEDSSSAPVGFSLYACTAFAEPLLLQVPCWVSRWGLGEGLQGRGRDDETGDLLPLAACGVSICAGCQRWGREEMT